MYAKSVPLRKKEKLAVLKPQKPKPLTQLAKNRQVGG
jgi:hypothetical protein